MVDGVGEELADGECVTERGKPEECDDGGGLEECDDERGEVEDVGNA